MSDIDRLTGLVGYSGVKVPVRCATTGAITLSGEQTIDAIACVTGDRVLVKDQASSIDNGIYVVDSGDWSRAPDCDGPYDLRSGSLVPVYSGTVNGTAVFQLTTSGGDITIGTDALTFASMGLLSVPIPVASGGTGAITAAAARTALGATFAVIVAPGGDMTGGINDALTTVASATTPDIFATTVGNVVDYTGTATCTGFAAAPQAGARRVLVCAGAAVFTAGANMLIDGVVSGNNLTAAAGDKIHVTAVTTTQFRLTAQRYSGQAVAPTPLRSYLAGAALSTAGGSGTMSIAAGSIVDSTNAALMALSAISKTTSAWAVGTGNGGLDTGAIANSTWYAFYAIQRPDTGVVDVIFSTNGSLPTLPANYTLYRRIGWGLTDGSAHWVLFSQDGDRFRWDVPVNDLNDGAVTITRVTKAVTAAPSCDAVMSLSLSSNAAGVETVLLTALAQTDTAPSATICTAKCGSSAAGGTSSSASDVRIKLDSSRQLGYRRNTASTGIVITTLGWVDRRGRDG